MTTTSPETDKTVQPLTRDTMKPGGRYNWKNQPDRLVYLGRYGGWHQFRKIGDPRDVWCEVLDADLHMLEETRVAPQAAPAPEPSAQGEPVACVTEEMVTAYLTANDAYWKRIDGEPTKLGKWRNGTPSEATRVSLMAALASAPSTPPHAVVGAVPIPDCTVADVGFRWDMGAQRHVPQVLVEFEPTPPNSPVDAKGWKDRNAFAALVKSRGIAPKAAQP